MRTSAMGLRLCVKGVIVLGLAAGCAEPNSPASPEPLPSQALPSSLATPVEGQPSASDLCNIESIGGVVFASDALSVKLPADVAGWLGGIEGRPPESPVLVVLDATGAVMSRISLTLGGSRPDVEQAFPGVPGLAASGFRAKVPQVSTSGQSVRLHLAFTDSGRSYICDNGREVLLQK